MTYSFISSELSVEGEKLSDLDDQILKMHNNNLELEDQLLHDEAYTTIGQEATHQGFVQGTILYLQP